MAVPPLPTAPESIVRFDRGRALLEAEFDRKTSGRFNDPSRFEVKQALLDLAAGVAHLLGVTFEVGFDQLSAATAALIGPMIRHADSVGEVVRGYRPGATEMIAELSSVPGAPSTLWVADQRWATDADEQQVAISYSNDSDVDVVDIQLYTASTVDEDTGVTVDISAEMRSVAASAVAVFPAVPAVGDRFDIAFPDGQAVNGITIDLTVAAANLTIAWGTYSGFSIALEVLTVTDLGGTAMSALFQLPTGFGSGAGFRARLTSRITGGYQDAFLTASGSLLLLTTVAVAPSAKEADGYLGQAAPSLDPADYEIRFEHFPLLNGTDGTAGLTVDGAVDFDLPEEHPQYPGILWVAGTPEATGTRRVLSALVVGIPGAVTVPILEYVNATTGAGFVYYPITQGSIVGPQSLGAHGGDPDEVFSFGSGELVFEGAAVFVDEGTGAVEWTQVSSFINSDAADRHVKISRTPSEDGGFDVLFGDGTNGKIPAAASPVTVTFSVGGDLDGNVGPNKIVINADGVTGITKVWNPVAVAGWQVADGATEASFEALRQRVINAPFVAHAPISMPDHEKFARDFTDAGGVSIISRAFGRSSTTDPKVVILVVVGAGGGTLTTAQLQAVEDYFNDPETGVIIVNHAAQLRNYTPRPIPLVLTITRDGAAYNGTAAAVAAEARRYLSADSDEAGEKRYNPGGEVTANKIEAHLYGAFPMLKGSRYELLLTTPAADVALVGDELPSASTVTINGVAY